MKNLGYTLFGKGMQAAPLAVFRILFGLVMFASMLRFWLNGWIEKLYILPEFAFSYYGFEWVRPLGEATYLLFVVCSLSALSLAVGYKYRLSVVLFFLSFTYIELMDKTAYLNHYYLISLFGFLLIFLPGGAYFSVDAYRDQEKAYQKVPAWSIRSIQLLIGMVYFYAGLAKINTDWLLRAMPLKIWLPSNYDLPFLGGALQLEWVHYLFSWTGMFFDLSIPFLLMFRSTRGYAFFLVVSFHLLTGLLFPIGMFPYIMILSGLVFFEPRLHHRILERVSSFAGIEKRIFDNRRSLIIPPLKKNLLSGLLVLFFTIQAVIPWRYLVYPGELFWTEEGFRFSWRVMLMEKAGYAQFRIVQVETGKQFYIDNDDFLTPFQEKQMSFQPDFILEYAHYLADHFEKKGMENIKIYVESYVALNGRKSTRFIDPNVNLLEYSESFRHKSFILPFHDNIQGL